MKKLALVLMENNDEKIKCLTCYFGTITNIGSLYCARFKEVLSMNPQLLLPAKSNGVIRGFKIRQRIDKCDDYKDKL